jgi:hypothetical protein
LVLRQPGQERILVQAAELDGGRSLNGGGGIVWNGVGEARHSHCNHWSWTWRRDYSRLVATRGLPSTGIRTGSVL